MSGDESDRRVCVDPQSLGEGHTEMGRLTLERRFEYLWQDSENYKKPTKMPAPAYIEQLMSWVQSNIDNEAVLPSRIGKRFHPHDLPMLYGPIIDTTRFCRRSLSKIFPEPRPPDF
jgi:hypothetical protein